KLFDAVQAKLDAQRRSHNQIRRSSAAILAGRLFDDRGQRMTPTHTRKGATKYRYYISRALVEGQPEQAGSIGRIPAANRSLATGLRFPRKLNLQAQRQAGQNRPVALAGLYGDGNANKESAHWPHFRRPSGNFHMRRTAWWAREDLNLQPDRYERSALTI